MTGAEALTLAALFHNGGRGVAKGPLTKKVNWFTLKGLMMDGVIMEHERRYYLSSGEEFRSSEKFDDLMYVVGLSYPEVKRIKKENRSCNNEDLRKALTKFVGRAILDP